MTGTPVIETSVLQGSLLRVDKGNGPTSHDVVHAVRRHLGMRRVGHAGTLDPQATGLLVIGVGSATRLLGYVASLDKVYRGEMRLGIRTDSMDAAGTEIARKPWSTDEGTLQETARNYLGEFLQRPPMVSAVKVRGERLYRIAARGGQVERPLRKVRVRRLDLIHIDLTEGRIEFEIQCSSGTYVRALADEWGERLGTYAHLGSLRRLRVGEISVDGAYPAEKLAPRGEHPAGQGGRRGNPVPESWRDLDGSRLPWSVALSHISRRELNGSEAHDLSFGRAPRSKGEEGLLRLEDENSGLLGIAEGTPAGLPLKLRCVLAVRSEAS
jgi:tRNA pseudouridine55 synthase